jgi:hypothetical protein
MAKAWPSGARGILVVAATLGAATFARTAVPPAPPADFAGVWIPISSATLGATDVQMTERGRAALADFDPRRHDSTRFCMPYGTPRNTLGTAPYPLEILQRPERLTMIFDRLGDVRRIFLDGRPRPDPLWPTWLGHSLGHWEGKTLVVETVALTKESVLTDAGLPHSEDMNVVERLTVKSGNGASVLRDDITITDPAMYTTPIKVIREFRRTDDAQMSEGSVSCLVDQWRQDLERRTRTLADELRGSGKAAP